MKTGEKDYTDFFLAFLAATVLTTTPGVFTVGHCTMWAGPLRIYIYIYIYIYI